MTERHFFILYDKFLGSEQKITFHNQEKLFFSILSSFVHFRESLLRIRQESLLLILQRLTQLP
jgi:hypothetical protein